MGKHMRNLDVMKAAGVTPRRRVHNNSALSVVATTAKLRRALHDRRTPQAAKTRIYHWLLVRSHRRYA